jgi:hypothetical protein
MKFFGRFGVLNPQEEVMGVFESEGEKGHIVLYDTTPLTVYLLHSTVTKGSCLS